MRLEELKKGLWGYKKDEVIQYLSQQEELFAQKMAEKDAQLEQMNRQAQSRIQALEQDARSSAERLKAESRAQEEAARETVRRMLEQDMAVLDGYRQQLADLRLAIQTAMKGLEQQTEAMDQQAEELLGAAPQGNLTLFQ